VAFRRGRPPVHEPLLGLLQHDRTLDQFVPVEGDDAPDAERFAHSLQIGGEHIERQIARIAG